jgi:hypothetical protein
MHEPHSYPQNPIRPSPQGRISITIGKVAVDGRRDKARPCHLSGTEVIGHETASYVTRRRCSLIRKRARRALRSLALSQGRLRGFARLAPDPLGKLGAGSSLRKKRLLRMTNASSLLVNERRYFPLLRFDPAAELRRWRDCFLRSASGKRRDHAAASHPSG